MDPSIGQNNEKKNIAFSILVGFGFSIIGFIIGSAVTFLLIFLFFNVMGTFSEVGPMLAIGLSPLIGILIAIIIGFRSGRKHYKRISARLHQEK